jgi:hypothetical protein
LPGTDSHSIVLNGLDPVATGSESYLMQGWRELVEQSSTGNAEARATLSGAFGMVKAMPTTLSLLASHGPNVPIANSSATPEFLHAASVVSNAFPMSSEPSSLLQAAKWFNTEGQKQQPVVPVASTLSPTLATSNVVPAPIGLPALDGGIAGPRDVRRGSGPSASYVGMAPGAKTSSTLTHAADAAVAISALVAVSTATTPPFTSTPTATVAAAAAAAAATAASTLAPRASSTDTIAGVPVALHLPKYQLLHQRQLPNPYHLRNWQLAHLRPLVRLR